MGQKCSLSNASPHQTDLISTNSIYSSFDSSVDKRINRLKTGHSNLSEHRWKMKIPDTSSPLDLQVFFDLNALRSGHEIKSSSVSMSYDC